MAADDTRLRCSADVDKEDSGANDADGDDRRDGDDNVEGASLWP
jgi:hypothetical protein